MKNFNREHKVKQLTNLKSNKQNERREQEIMVDKNHVAVSRKYLFFLIQTC